MKRRQKHDLCALEERFIGDNPSSRLGGNVKATTARLTCNGLRHSRLWIESLIGDHGRRRFYFFSSLVVHRFKRAIGLHAATVHSPRFSWMYASAPCILEAEYRVQTSNCASACANFEGGFLNTRPDTSRANVDSASKLALAVQRFGCGCWGNRAPLCTLRGLKEATP